MSREPQIRVHDVPSGELRGVVLVLHGGRQRSYQRVPRWSLAYQRMVRFARALAERGAEHGVAVWSLRNRYRGWNAPELSPVADARFALERIRQAHPGAPVVLLGHSMGGRVAFRVADDPAVRAVCALAPWTEPGEPVKGVRGRTVLIAHGDEERMTDPALSYSFALRAKRVTDAVCRFDVHGDGHAMLRRAGDWTELVLRFCLGELGVEPVDPVIANALLEPAPEGLRVPLAKGTR